jgi:glycosyltransferase involved in cell wall biosynthesis/SAM-dependent methyltransferase
MAHKAQREFCDSVRLKYPEMFKNKKVLDVGSLDNNGNNRFLFDNCEYIGIDVGEGSNVDFVSAGHEYDAPDEYFDVIICTEVFEHDIQYDKTVANIIRMLKTGGIFVFTCAAPDRPEHGTRRTSPWHAKLLEAVSEEWSDYYKNLTHLDFKELPNFDKTFPNGYFELRTANIAEASDLYFYGIKGDNSKKEITDNMKTKKPSAIVYGWDTIGTETLISDVYFEEALYDEVIVYSLPYTDNVFEDYTKYKPNLIISLGDTKIETRDFQLSRIHVDYDYIPEDNVLANIIVCQSVFRGTTYFRPRFSIFTPTYQTGERIRRTYESLANQTFGNWEWVIVDDSPDEVTWDILMELKDKDYRVKPHRIYPLSGGNIGLAKNRAAMLCDGDWLVELDHDDALTSQCLEISNNAILQYPDAGFLYSDVCELYENGEMKTYDYDLSGNWYGRHDNYFDFGYAGHTQINVDGKDIIAHWYPDINPLTIRFNISMPDHVRMWERTKYLEMGGHNKNTPVADDLEMIIKTFLNTRMIHVKKVLYLQYNNKNSTVDNNSTDINRRARLIRDHYDLAIHNRILELGFKDWNWDEELKHSQKFQNRTPFRMYHNDEQVMNYIYE